MLFLTWPTTCWDDRPAPPYPAEKWFLYYIHTERKPPLCSHTLHRFHSVYEYVTCSRSRAPHPCYPSLAPLPHVTALSGSHCYEPQEDSNPAQTASETSSLPLVSLPCQAPRVGQDSSTSIQGHLILLHQDSTHTKTRKQRLMCLATKFIVTTISAATPSPGSGSGGSVHLRSERLPWGWGVTKGPLAASTQSRGECLLAQNPDGPALTSRHD